MPVLTRAQAREVDRFAMEELGLPGLVLMENAARGIADACLDELEGARGPVAIVCGPGNNGGDGFATARHLANAGLEVRLHLLVPPEAYGQGSDPAINLEVVRRMGLDLREDLDLAEATLLVDAVFGTGLTREVEGAFRTALEALNAANAPVLAVDLPSGLDADTGLVHGIATRAAVTATMVAPKVGFTLAAGPEHVGRVITVEIGIPPSVVARIAAG